jgi:glycosyltransferase involved in cell wall biosynthesis
VGTCRGGGSIQRQKERLLWRLADHHICNASPLRDALMRQFGVPEDRISLCENGVDILPSQQHSPAGKHILSVGRLVEDKDQATLIKAFALTLRSHPDAQLTLVGDGELDRQLLDLASVLGISDKISFLPGRPDLSNLYADCTFFALSSRTEASPNVLLEAAAAGKAVVATRVGGIPDLVEHERTGLLVDSGSPEQMAEALSRLLGAPDLCRNMGDAGRELVRDKYSVQNMVDRHASIFSTLHDRLRG